MRRPRKPLKHLLAVAALLCLVAPGAAAKRRAAVGSPEVPQDPAGWLAARAYVLATVDYPAPSSDLQPLREIVGDARIVGLADGTHGTREFFTLKLRMIDVLVRQMDFDVVSFEAPLPLFDRIDVYVQGGGGDPRALLAEGYDRLRYVFWDVEEMLAVIEWMRDYNSHRGSRPPVHIAGFDIYDGVGAAATTVEHVRRADPALATNIEAQYLCVTATPNPTCRLAAEGVVNLLIARRADLERESPMLYHEALQNARVVVQSQTNVLADRDRAMAGNAEWLNEHRGRSGRTIVWAHAAHLAKGQTAFLPVDSMGVYLSRSLGRSYVAIGALTGGGTFLQWEPPGANSKPVVRSLPSPGPDSYEANFRLGPAPALLIPLAGTVPPWLAGPAFFTGAGTAAAAVVSRASLPALFDAVVYVERTTATKPLRQ